MVDARHQIEVYQKRTRLFFSAELPEWADEKARIVLCPDIGRQGSAFYLMRPDFPLHKYDPEDKTWAIVALKGG